MDVLFILSRLGVWMFMFLVGMELDLTLIRRAGKMVLVTSQGSILLPLLLGSAVGVTLYPEFAGGHVSIFAFALFLGVAMSITAFPVLASLLKERGMLSSELGTKTIACAAVNDVAAYILLAVTALIINPEERPLTLLYRFLGLLVYFLFMWLVARPLLHRAAGRQTSLSREYFGGMLALLFISCMLTQVIGIHALFGAFFFGIVMPKSEWLVKGMSDRIEPLTTTIFLPIFFAYSGIRTNVGLINSGRAWMICTVIIAAAVIGKYTGTALGARLMGQNWSQASALGALMNTRGLMELVILNVGLELSVISPALFSMMVVMAVVTTFMTSPWLDWILRRERLPAGVTTTA